LSERFLGFVEKNWKCITGKNPERGTATRFTAWMAIILRFSFSPFLFIPTLFVCYLNLLQIRRENSQESKVSDFAAISTLIPIGNFISFGVKPLSCRGDDPFDRPPMGIGRSVYRSLNVGGTKPIGDIRMAWRSSLSCLPSRAASARPEAFHPNLPRSFTTRATVVRAARG
jgi:hypothetical protein